MQMTRPSTYAFRVDMLPPDVFEYLTRLLTGFDLFRLSHVNQRLWTELLATPEIWTTRTLERHYLAKPPLLSGPQAKRRYLQSHSLRFHGPSHTLRTHGDRGACVPVPAFYRRNARQARGLQVPYPTPSHSFTFDLWFCLLPPPTDDPSVFVGGVLLGSQSVPWQATTRWADNHLQFVHVDRHRNLYCSVLDQKTVVASDLQMARWYHVALSFDGGEQLVYFNGSLVCRTVGSSHYEWRYLHYSQLGTGCISGGSMGKPTPEFCGWYAFHGLIDEFRLWSRALSASDAQLLADGRRIKVIPVYSLQEDVKRELCGAVKRVQCSRPRERIVHLP
ncbi:hypothetical protein Poli38472_004380 [Pythium oligandrum]|uniref:F-box domain-containing protein n=1 Tax=Pythium oligandrum TaxID=41045 RepID=A0A8K1FED6_PYTOL|nr:hypothetical protein Poli38472_004380 [Pythium oligandrum]|eukprot:TMW59311.1 hypothetical protein Poli38472_004380 [Pythium oligandrum]